MRKGFIVLGYQGIGKSALAEKNDRFVDLESSAFYIAGVRPDRWEIPYVQTAEHLAKQGRIVLLSSHKVVRKASLNTTVGVIACLPTKELRDAWVKKLKLRWQNTREPKDFRAYFNAHDRMLTDIDIIKDEVDHVIWIDNMDYDLEKMILDWEANV